MAADEVPGQAQVRGAEPDAAQQTEVTNALWTHMIQSMSDQVRSGSGQETFGPLNTMLQGMGAPMDEGESELDLVQEDIAGRRAGGEEFGGAPSAGPGGMPQRSFSGPIPELLGPVQPGEDGVPHGLQPNAARGAAAVRRLLGFEGEIGGLGQRSNKSDHPHGNAIDIMTHSDKAFGWEAAEFFRSNRNEFGVTYVIFDGLIASPRNGWEWRPYSHPAGRNDPTAMHEDHPHISFQGGAPSMSAVSALPAGAASTKVAGSLPAAGQRWAPEITEAANAAGIDPALLGALVEAESNFDPNVRSHAGAIGLAQLMPDTARALGVDPSDPRQNLLGGARYLKEQLDRFGRVDLALAAYNAGPGRVQQAGGIPNITETRNYVEKVMSAWLARRGDNAAPVPQVATTNAPQPRPSAPAQPRQVASTNQPQARPEPAPTRRPAAGQQGGPAPAPRPSPTDRPKPKPAPKPEPRRMSGPQ